MPAGSPLCHARHPSSGIHPQNFLPEVAIQAPSNPKRDPSITAFLRIDYILKRRTIGIRVNHDVAVQPETRAAAEGRSISNLVERIILASLMPTPAAAVNIESNGHAAGRPRLRPKKKPHFPPDILFDRPTRRMMGSMNDETVFNQRKEIK